jgi:adenosylcobinamide-phosphate guanylyltransferase
LRKSKPLERGSDEDLKVTALVMAGGKGKRLALSEEKPLLQVGDRPVIEHVLAALKEAKKVESIVVAVSPYTPKTAMHLKNLGIEVVETPGKEYVHDMGYAIKKLHIKTALTLASDLPLITGNVIDETVKEYERCGKPALSVVVTIATKERLGLGRDYVFELDKQLVAPAGINVIDGRHIDDKELDQVYCLIDKEEVAVNINTAEDLKKARELFEKQNSKN